MRSRTSADRPRDLGRAGAIRRLLGVVLVSLATLAGALFLAGWLAALQLGSVVERGDDRARDGSRWWVVPTTGSGTTCTLTSGTDGETRTLRFAERGPRGGFDLAETQRQVTPGGITIGPDGAPATLSCSNDVRVVSGGAALLAPAAEAGFWLIVPVAVLVVGGGALLRTRSADQH